MMIKKPYVNIHCKIGQGWIMSRMAHELVAAGIAVLNYPVGEMSIEYYLPYDTYKQGGGEIEVGYFTHLEEPSASDSEHMQRKIKRFLSAAENIKHKIVMNQEMFSRLGLDKSSGAVIKPSAEYYKKIRFGVCGRPYKSGRKNEKFIQALAALGVDIVAWGSPDWGVPEIQDLREFYFSIDYLIIPSSNEGGPVPMLEALALGVPVIAPDVGFCWEYPVIRYLKNDYEDLKKIVIALNTPRTWRDWASEHDEYFRKLLNEKN
jgi:glycosyltransferase involved in cell wall biosynthesis